MEVYSMARQFNAEPKDVIKIIRDENRAGCFTIPYSARKQLLSFTARR